MTKRNSFNSGAFRFALVIAGLFAFGSFLLIIVVDRSLHSYADEATAVGLNAETTILLSEISDGGPSELVDTIRHRQSSKTEHPFRYLLVDAKGDKVAGDLPVTAAEPGWSSVRFLDDRPEPGEEGMPEELRSLGTRLRSGELLVVATDTFDIQKVRRRVDGLMIWSAAGITIVALLGGYLIGGIFLRRLERVNEAVARIMDGRLAERLPPIGMSPEFNHLSRNLNNMLDRISHLMEGLRQVSTDIAHDLRTPLTRLRQQLEDMRGVDAIDSYDHHIDSALAQTDAILDVFRALMMIGTIEGGDGRQTFAIIDFSDVVVRVVQMYRPIVEDAGRRIEPSIAPFVFVSASPELFAQLISNLIENAIKYTPPGTSIAISVTSLNGEAVLVFSDDGPGVASHDRERILHRFYRADASRGKPGAGLGLALVAAIVKLHHGRLEVEDNDPGLRFRVTLPAISGNGLLPDLLPDADHETT